MKSLVLSSLVENVGSVGLDGKVYVYKTAIGNLLYNEI